MPNKHAAIKDLRKNRKHETKNVRMKTHIGALTHQFEALVREGKKNDAVVLAKKLQQTIAKASKNLVFHPNKASRRVSQMHRALSTIK